MEMFDGGKWHRQHYFNFIFDRSTVFSLVELLKVINDWRKKRYDFLFDFFAYMHLFKREMFHSYKKSRKFFTFFTFEISIILHRELKNVGLFGQVTA